MLILPLFPAQWTIPAQSQSRIVCFYSWLWASTFPPGGARLLVITSVLIFSAQIKWSISRRMGRSSRSWWFKKQKDEKSQTRKVKISMFLYALFYLIDYQLLSAKRASAKNFRCVKKWYLTIPHFIPFPLEFRITIFMLHGLQARVQVISNLQYSPAHFIESGKWVATLLKTAFCPWQKVSKIFWDDLTLVSRLILTL